MRLSHKFLMDPRSISGLLRWTPLLAVLVFAAAVSNAQTNPPASTNREDVALRTLEQPSRISINEVAPPENPAQPINPPEPTDGVPGMMPPPPGDNASDAPPTAATASGGNSEAQRSPENASVKPPAPVVSATSSNGITTKPATPVKPGEKPLIAVGGEPLPAAPAKADFAAFKIISERNIFDPNRSPRRGGGPPVRAKTVESVTLVGIMSYGKGDFAFFNGTSSDYKKVLKPSDTIAGYKVASISANSVKLASGEKQVELKIGSQLRREDEGEWKLSSPPETYSAASATSSAGAVSDGSESEVLKRLMQRREQE